MWPCQRSQHSGLVSISILLWNITACTNVGVFCFAGGRSTNNAIPRQHQQRHQRQARSKLFVPSEIANRKGHHRQLFSPSLKASSLSASSNNPEENETENGTNDNLHDNTTEVGQVDAPRGGASSDKFFLVPAFDDLDRKIIKIALPCIANFAITPLVGAVDLFWINRMGNTLAVAGQAAANQIFSSFFWLASFLPSVTGTLVAKEHAKGNEEGVQDAVCQAFVVAIIIALACMPIVFFQPERMLGAVLEGGAPALQYAKPYLLIRSFAFLPSLISLVGFSAFRGTLDTVTPVKISSFANIFNVICDPFLIFTLSMGVPGAALATLVAEIISAVLYTRLMLKKKMIKWAKVFRLPSWKKLEPLLKGGAALQLRNFALNITFLAVTRVTQSMDNTGVAAAANALAIQTFQLGAIVLLALSLVAQILVPNEMVERYDEEKKEMVGGIVSTKATVKRLMNWGFVLGCSLGALQMAVLPLLMKSTPVQAVRDAAWVPSILASVYQIMNGLVFIGEGVMVGTGNFMQLSISTVVATSGCLCALRVFPKMFGLTGVWMGFGVFNLIRLVGVILHQTRFGPFAARNMKKIEVNGA